jgi:hypothetical protein
MAVVLYAVLLRRGAARLLAALAVAPVLLDAYQLQMEQTIMADVWFEAMIVAGLAVLLWRPAVTVPFAAAAGLILGSSATVKQLGELLVRALIWVPGVIVCLCVLLLQLAPQHGVRTPGSRRYDYGGPSRYIAEHAQPGDGILFVGKFYRKAELGYPGDFRNTSDFAMAVSPLRAGDSRAATSRSPSPTPSCSPTAGSGCSARDRRREGPPG